MAFTLKNEVVAELPDSRFGPGMISPDTAALIEHARNTLPAHPNQWVKVLEADKPANANMYATRLSSHKPRLTNGVGGTYTFRTRGTTLYGRYEP